MTVTFKITVSGQGKHINYTDRIEPKNSDAEFIQAGAAYGKDFDAKKALDEKGRVIVAVALTAEGKHNVVKWLTEPEHGETYDITDADLPP